MSAPTNGNIFQRLWAGWNDFWFKPTDPTTLGVMRILGGVLTLYVLFAYTPDLTTFFGRHAWFDTQASDDFRKEMPVATGPIDWGSLEASVTLPNIPAQRIEVVSWLRNLGDVEERKPKLAYLHWIHSKGPGYTPFNDDMRQAIVFAAALPEATAERDEIFARMAEAAKRNQDIVTAGQALRQAQETRRDAILLATLQSNGERLEADRAQYVEKLLKDTPIIPGWMARTLSEEDLATARRHILTFRAGLPVEGEPRTAVVEWLKGFFPNNASNDPRLRDYTPRQRFLGFVNGLPNDADERNAVLNYLDKWNVDPGQTYAKGNVSWSWLYHVDSPAPMLVLHFLCMGVVLLFTLGVATRYTSVLTWLAVISYTQRSQHTYVFGMDTMMNIFLVYMMLAPCGAALSIDRLFERYRRMRQALAAGRPADALVDQGPALSVSANFATRLFQIHFCFIYLASGLAKLKGGSWWDHTATWYTMVNPEFCPTNNWIYIQMMSSVALYRPVWQLAMSLGTAFTLCLEIGLPFLIWNRRLRPFLMAGSVMLHLGIGLIMGLNVFSLFMMTLLLSYMPPSAFRSRFALPSLPKLRLRAAGETGARSASWLYAFDAWGQIEAVETNVKGDRELEVSTQGTVLTGQPALRSAAKTLRGLWLFSGLVGLMNVDKTAITKPTA